MRTIGVAVVLTAVVDHLRCAEQKERENGEPRASERVPQVRVLPSDDEHDPSSAERST